MSKIEQAIDPEALVYAEQVARMVLEAKPGACITLIVDEQHGEIKLRSTHGHYNAIASIDEAKGMLHEAVGKKEGRFHDLSKVLH